MNARSCFIFSVTASLALFLSACGSTPKKNDLPPAAVEGSHSAQDIVALGQSLARHRRAIYSSARQAYLYYITNELAAQYGAQNHILSLSDENGAVCEYSPTGVLLSGTPGAAPSEEQASTCQTLAAILANTLSR